MTTTMVRMGSGFFIPKLDGFDDIKKDTIEVDIELNQREHKRLSYKELKRIAIIQRYQERLKNQIEIDSTISLIQKNFRDKHKIKMNLDSYLKVK
jgi:hypothetical protein